MDCLNTLWCGDEIHEADSFASMSLEAGYGICGAATSREHGIDDDNDGILHALGHLVIVLDRLMSSLVPVQANMTDMRGGHELLDAIDHADTRTEYGYDGEEIFLENRERCFTYWRGDLCSRDLEIAGYFVAHEQGYFIEKHPEVFRIRILITHTSQFVRNKRMFYNVHFAHVSTFHRESSLLCIIIAQSRFVFSDAHKRGGVIMSSDEKSEQTEEKLEKKTAFVSTMGAEDAPDAVYDARQLGVPKMIVFGFQHMFAMFGATILVPVLTGLSVSATLLFAGLGTLLFHFLSQRKVPAFLGSSFAFIAGYAAIAPNGETELLPYACLGVACAGLLYLVLSALFRIFGAQRVMRYFPPVVTGPIVISIGLILASSAIANCETNWIVALVAIVTIFVCNLWGRGMIKIVPILLGVIVSYIVAACLGQVDFSSVADAAWIGLPVLWDNTVFSLAGPNFDAGLATTAIITIMPIALATMIEHIGDISAISFTCNRNYISDPGLHRTLLGDGLATILASLFGAPANTTYGENTGVLALTRVFDPRVVRIAALFAILFSFCPKFSAVIGAMPASVIGGVSLVLYGMISAVGIRNLVENRVNFVNMRNVLITALILVLSIGIAYSDPGAIVISIGEVTISLSGLAVGSLVGIILNIVLPGKTGYGEVAPDDLEQASL